MKIAFIGIGKVGFALANKLQQKGHDILVAHNNPASESVQKAIQKNAQFAVSPLQQAIDQADIICLAVPYPIAGDLLQGLEFNGKTLVDCTNPVGPGISHRLNSQQSGSEVIQQKASWCAGGKGFFDLWFRKLCR